MRKIIILLLLVMSNRIGATIQNYNEIIYNECVLHIKSCEGFRSNAYVSLNNRYIGYGHLIKKHETLTNISEQEATKLLKADLNACIKVMHNYTKLKGNKLLAISLLSYNLGAGKVCKYIREQDILNNYSLTLNYCKYKVNGIVKHSEKLYKRRLFEYNLFWKNE